MTVYLAVLGVLLIISLTASPAAGFAGQFDNSPARPASQPLLLALSGALLFCVSALRWRVGTDYRGYAASWASYLDGPLSITAEPGIKVIARVGTLISDDYVPMFALAAAATIGLCIWTIYRYSVAPQFSVLLFVLGGAWHGSFNSIRQYIACAILFAGHRFAVNRRFVPYLVIVFVASLFHVSALVAIFLYFVPTRRLGVGSLILLFVATVIVGSLHGQLIGVAEAIREADISESAYYLKSINPTRILFAFSPVVLYAIFTDKDSIRAPEFYYANLAVVNSAVWLASFDSAYVARFATYTNIFLVLSIPILLNHRDVTVKTSLSVIVLIAFSIFWYFDIRAQTPLTDFQWIFDR